MKTTTLSYITGSTAQQHTEWTVPGIGSVTITPATDPALVVDTQIAANGVFALHTFSSAIPGQTYQVTVAHATEPEQIIQVNRESQP
jgi:hypothetical protein